MFQNLLIGAPNFYHLVINSLKDTINLLNLAWLSLLIISWAWKNSWHWRRSGIEFCMDEIGGKELLYCWYWGFHPLFFIYSSIFISSGQSFCTWPNSPYSLQVERDSASLSDSSLGIWWLLSNLLWIASRQSITMSSWVLSITLFATPFEGCIFLELLSLSHMWDTCFTGILIQG